MIATRSVDRAFAAGLLGLGAYIVRDAVAYGYMRNAVPGPGFFPLWVGLGLIVLSAFTLVRSVRGGGEVESRFDTGTFLTALVITGIVLLFVVASPWLGMLVSIGAAIPAIAFAIQPRWTPRFASTIAIMAVAFPAFAYLLFSVYLRVPLVRGVFGF